MKKVSALGILLGLLVALVLSSWAAPSFGQGTAPAAPIRIGCLLPLTGALMNQGPHLTAGIQLALEHYRYEVAGRKIELIIEDSATDPTTALDKARKLVERDNVRIVIGPQASHVAQAVQPYFTEKKIICLKSRQFPIPLTAKFPYLFAVDGTHKQTTAPMGDYAYNVLGSRKVSTIVADFIAGRDVAAGFTERFVELGGKIVQEQWFPVEAMDFANYLANINVKETDCVAAWTGGPGGPRFAKQYEEYGLKQKLPLIAPFLSGIFDEDVLPRIGDSVLGVPGAASYASTVDNALNKRVVADHMKKYGKRPTDSGIIGGYVNMQIALEALKVT
ncbi:MAG TPA: ABC transporter substrate-binding protein, partial [Dehalococcoidia bacterium]|nr:ABC transporter substrate-binding protein [Dehalococcoidia bacterium]